VYPPGNRQKVNMEITGYQFIEISHGKRWERRFWAIEGYLSEDPPPPPNPLLSTAVSLSNV
jgi:hypothetical protein